MTQRLLSAKHARQVIMRKVGLGVLIIGLFLISFVRAGQEEKTEAKAKQRRGTGFSISRYFIP
jgi:hypothetical protein